MDELLYQLVSFMKGLPGIEDILFPVQAEQEKGVIDDEKLLTMVPPVATKFVELLPHIREVDIVVDAGPDDDSREFTTKWVELLCKQLTAFHCNQPLAPSVTQFSMEQTQFTCSCDFDSYATLPKINPLPLTYLCLLEPPRDFTWQCFQPKEKVLAFPNLATLKSPSYNMRSFDQDGEYNRLMDLEATPGSLLLQFPKLKTLEIWVSNYEGILFKPDILSFHLDPLKIEGNEIALGDFGTLAIEFVDYLAIHVDKYDEGLNDEFYRLTNHWFNGEVTIFKETSVNIYHGLIHSLDLERTEWASLNKMMISNHGLQICIQSLLLILCAVCMDQIMFWLRL